MGHDFETVTTRRGDGGQTSDYAGRLDWKDSPLFGVLGDLDELSSWLGLITHDEPPWHPRVRRSLRTAQARLQTLGSMVATPPDSPEAERISRLSAADVEEIEEWEQRLFNGGLVIKPQFVLPGQNRASARADVARTVCRRAERHLVGLIRESDRSDLVPGARYLNRLSDWLYLLARDRER